MLRRALAASRYVVLVAVLGTFIASLALLLYEAGVVAVAVVGAFRGFSASPKAARALAVGLIETVDIFLV
jgi:uncharacterized membrane protein YqhA